MLFMMVVILQPRSKLMDYVFHAAMALSLKTQAEPVFLVVHCLACVKNATQMNVLFAKSYLQLLSNSFPTIAEASTEIINLQAILNLPKGTEHFLADFLRSLTVIAFI